MNEIERQWVDERVAWAEARYAQRELEHRAAGKPVTSLDQLLWVYEAGNEILRATPPRRGWFGRLRAMFR